MTHTRIHEGKIYYKVREVAEILGVSDSLVRSWIHSKRIKARNISSISHPWYRIHRDVLAELMYEDPTEVPKQPKPRRKHF